MASELAGSKAGDGLYTVQFKALRMDNHVLTNERASAVPRKLEEARGRWLHFTILGRMDEINIDTKFGSPP